MSGSILSAITAAGKLFAGYGTVTLGPVRFTGLSLPPSLPIGGKQGLSIKTLPGGAVVVDVMGPVFADKVWTGYLDGPTASETSRTLDKMWQSGGVFTLAWNVYSYQVIIEQFICNDKLVVPIKYNISCKVLSDNSHPTGTTLTSLALQVSSDLANGNPLAALSSVSQGVVGTSVSTAGTAAGVTGATTIGSAAYNDAVGAVNTAATAIQSATTAVNQTLAPLGVSLSSLSLAAPAALATTGFAADLTSATAACGDLANLSAAQGFVERAQQNLTRASA